MNSSTKRSARLPLSIIDAAPEIGPTGTLGIGLLVTRGLIAKRVHKNLTGNFIIHGQPRPRAELEARATELRYQLKAGNFPTDEDYVWIKEGENPWRPDTDPDSQVADGYVLRSWFEQLCAVVEPLSDAYVQGQLLHAITEMLGSHSSDEQLKRALQLAGAVADYALATQGNPLAEQEARERERRAKGPKTKKAQSPVKLKIVCRLAEELWRAKAIYRGDRSNTAAEIQELVNAELREHDFRPLSQKRIAAYISEGIRGGLF